jgi:NADH:ubiquinone oxidoreductase subunit E
MPEAWGTGSFLTSVISGEASMVTIVLCVGSSCYVRGSDRVAEIFERLIAQESLQDQVELQGAFCMEHCSMGVSVRVADHVYGGVLPEEAARFFYSVVVPLAQGVEAH